MNTDDIKDTDDIRDTEISVPEEMPRLQAVLDHPLYRQHYQKIQELELDREYCHHDMEHFLDVARIAYIRNLELQLGYQKELIYLVALLHDIGKDQQYLNKIPHEVASKEIAEVILRDISGDFRSQVFPEEELEWIRQGILGHRRIKEHMTEAQRLFYWSDKRSRKCFACKAKDTCNWKLEEKNMEIRI